MGRQKVTVEMEETEEAVGKEDQEDTAGSTFPNKTWTPSCSSRNRSHPEEEGPERPEKEGKEESL